MDPVAAPERGRGARNVLIAAVVSAVVTGGIYLVTRPEGAAPPASGAAADRGPDDSAPVVPDDDGPDPAPVAGDRDDLLRQVLRQLRAQLAELRAELRQEDDPAVRAALRAQIQALREGTRQVEQQLASN